MIGRAAYQQPALLAELEQRLFTPDHTVDTCELLGQYRAYAAAQLEHGETLHRLTRHTLNVCNGMRGARGFRRQLSDQQGLRSNDLSLFDAALAHVFDRAA